MTNLLIALAFAVVGYLAIAAGLLVGLHFASRDDRYDDDLY